MTITSTTATQAISLFGDAVSTLGDFGGNDFPVLVKIDFPVAILKEMLSIAAIMQDSAPLFPVVAVHVPPTVDAYIKYKESGWIPWYSAVDNFASQEISLNYAGVITANFEYENPEPHEMMYAHLGNIFHIARSNGFDAL